VSLRVVSMPAKALCLVVVVLGPTASHAERIVGLSGLEHPITTSSADAQAFFNQGLEMVYGFNHAAAADAFREAIELDSECAMCFWGVALALGPNINAPMTAADNEEAWDAVQTARTLGVAATAKERDYIEAMSHRYAPDAPEDRSALDKAYADAMRRLSAKHPADLDAATLFAESLMDTTPWDYWTDDNEPRRATTEFLGVLETVLRREPAHPGANHYLIHTVEKVRPELGVAAADRLENLAEGAGHLVHMGSHIYLRVGRYHDAARVNQKAIAADEAFASTHSVSQTYGNLYMLHNHHFLAAVASFEGRGELALSLARELASRVDTDAMRHPSFYTGQYYWATPYYVLVRFGRWDEILAEPAPDDDLEYPLGIWHYARGMALLRKGRLEEAAGALGALERLSESPKLDEVTVGDLNTTRALLQIARRVLGGEIAAASGFEAVAVSGLREAVRLEDALNYDEPPPWLFPARQSLGAVLLEIGMAAESEESFREDLEIFPRNGWSLMGLMRSLEAQGKESEAEAVRLNFEEVWIHADVEISSSRY
jgi:tetratricopeptide (TPR) repeat protein